MNKDLRIKMGFTLVELLISISMIAILSVVLSISFSNAQKNGRDQRRIADLKAIQNAAEQYNMLSGGYPAGGNYRTAAGAWTTPSGQVVLQKFPSDPKPSQVYVTGSSTGVTGYCVCADVEKNSNANSQNTNCDFQSTGEYFCVKNQQ